MTTYQGKCHCGDYAWDVTLSEDQSKHILCHCDTCKILGGGAFTMNQVSIRFVVRFSFAPKLTVLSLPRSSPSLA